MNETHTPEDFLPGLYSEVPEVIREIFHRMPWSVEITLANGRIGTLTKFAEPRQNPESGRWEFGFDVRVREGQSRSS